MAQSPSHPAVTSTPQPKSARTQRVLFIILPLAVGFFFTQLFRNANAVIAGDLIRDIGTNAAGLGLLTSVFFFAIAVTQIPMGMALDRFGPRCVQAALLLVAVAGALIFSLARTEVGLIIGRLLIGLGTAGGLMAGLKATRQWVPIERLSSVNGNFMMIGSLGALAATAPWASLVEFTGWRHAFDVLAVATLVLAFITYMMVPDAPTVESHSAQPGGMKSVLRNRLLWRFGPMSAMAFGAVTAFQGLWAARWFADVDRLPPNVIANYLLFMACGLIAGGPLFGYLARRFRGTLSAATLTLIAAVFLVVIEGIIVLRVPLPSVIMWSVLGIIGAIPVLSYGVVAEAFHSSMTGRANALLNIMQTSTVFGLQALVGVIVNLWQRNDGAYPPIAYQSAMALVIILQILAILNFITSRPWRHKADAESQLA